MLNIIQMLMQFQIHMSSSGGRLLICVVRVQHVLKVDVSSVAVCHGGRQELGGQEACESTDY